MAKRKAAGSMKSKMAKVNKAMSKVKDSTETFGGRMDLPPDLKGIAQFTAAKIDEYKSGDNKGELYMRLEGVIVQANKVDGMDYVGQYTSLMMKLHEVELSNGESRDVEEQVNRALGRLRAIGYDTSEAEEDIEAFLEECVEEGHYFTFTTSAQYDRKDKTKVTGVWENWHKHVEDFVPEDDEDVDDDTEEEEDDEEEEEYEEELDDEEDEDEDDEVEEEEDETEEEDEEEDEADDEEEDEEEEIEEPSKGENWYYKPPKKRKAILVTVKTVNKKSQICTVEDEEGTKYQKVPWDKLQYDE